MTIVKKFEVPKFWVGLLSLFLLVLVLIEIWVSNQTISFGAKFEKISVLERILDMENQLLENEIARSASLLNISSKSAELGFLKPSSVQYIR